MMFAKGYSKLGITGQSFHVHVRFPDDWDEIVFRDYLRRNKTASEDYAKLKRRLAVEFKNDRDKYTDSKKKIKSKPDTVGKMHKLVMVFAGTPAFNWI